MSGVLSKMHEISSQTSLLHRGQSNAEWTGLEPTLTRAVPKELGQIARLQIEREAAKVFGQIAGHHLHASDELLLQNPLSQYVLMQHFRAPTRLLDWSASPWVALYFAASTNRDKDGVVWTFDKTDIDLQSAGIHFELAQGGEPAFLRLLYSQNPGRVIMILDPARKNPRLAAQQSMFTVAGDLTADHAALIAEATPYQTHEKLHKLIIPKELKREIVLALASMNITPATLFPGLDGVGAAIADLIAHRHPGNNLISVAFLSTDGGPTTAVRPV